MLTTFDKAEALWRTLPRDTQVAVDHYADARGNRRPFVMLVLWRKALFGVRELARIQVKL